MRQRLDFRNMSFVHVCFLKADDVSIAADGACHIGIQASDVPRQDDEGREVSVGRRSWIIGFSNASSRIGVVGDAPVFISIIVFSTVS